MRTFFGFLAGLSLLFLTACDTVEPGPDPEVGTEVRYRTPLVDGAGAAAALPDGTVLAAGLTEGRIGEGDWTNGFPFLLRVRPDGTIADTTVYRDVRYGSVLGVVPRGEGLAVLVERQNYDLAGFETPALTLYQTTLDGVRRDTLFHRDAAFAASDPLHATQDGGLLLVLGRTTADSHDLIKLDPSGTVVWTYRMADVQFVTDVAETADGDLLVLGARTPSQFDVARLSPQGTVRWTQTHGGEGPDGAPLRRARAVAAAGEEAAVLGTRNRSDDTDPRSESLTLTRFNGTGTFLGEDAYATGPLYALALTALPGGGLALSYAESYGPDGFVGKERAFLVHLTPDGAVQHRWRFGPQRGTTQAFALVVLRGGRLAAVGSTGPEAIGGYGGDDFDVLTAFYDAGS